MRVQKLVTEWRKVSSLKVGNPQSSLRRAKKEPDSYRFRDQLPRHPIKNAES